MVDRDTSRSRGGDHASAACGAVREDRSARADGEAGVLGDEVVTVHLRDCPGCRDYATALPDLVRSSRVTEAPRVPDLTGRVLTAAVAHRPARRRVGTGELRLLVALAGMAQLALALPALLALGGPALHTGRELGALQVAVAVGLLLAAWQPSRSAGVLPIAVVVAAAVVVTAAVDVGLGVASPTSELSHLAEVVGVVALWRLRRRVPGGPALHVPARA